MCILNQDSYLRCLPTELHGSLDLRSAFPLMGDMGSSLANICIRLTKVRQMTYPMLCPGRLVETVEQSLRNMCLFQTSGIMCSCSADLATQFYKLKVDFFVQPGDHSYFTVFFALVKS